MRYKDAKTLRNEDEVLIKGTDTILSIIETEVQEKDVFIKYTDGCLYHHTALPEKRIGCEPEIAR